MARSLPNLHTTVHRRARIQDLFKVKVKVKDHVIRTFLWFHENRFLWQANGWNTTKLAHGRYLGCAQGQGRGQRSRETGTSVMSRNVCYTVPSDVLSLHALTLRSTITLSFQYKCQAARRNVYIIEWATPSLTVWLHFSTCQIAVNMVYKLQLCTFTIFIIICTSILVKPGNCPWQLQVL